MSGVSEITTTQLCEQLNMLADRLDAVPDTPDPFVQTAIRQTADQLRMLVTLATPPAARRGSPTTGGPT